MESTLLIQIKDQKIDNPPFSLRNVSQKIISTSETKTERTLDGKLHYFPKHKKYKTIISGTDINLPVLASFKIGDVIRIGSIVKFWHDVRNKKQLVLDRDPYKIFAYCEKNKIILLPNNKNIHIEESFSFIAFCPFLDAAITHVMVDRDEWNLKNSFIVEAEEV